MLSRVVGILVDIYRFPLCMAPSGSQRPVAVVVIPFYVFLLMNPRWDRSVDVEFGRKLLGS